MPKQHIVHPNATHIIEEHRKAIADRRALAKLEASGKEEADQKKEHLRVQDRIVSFLGQVHNARISKKSYITIGQI